MEDDGLGQLREDGRNVAAAVFGSAAAISTLGYLAVGLLMEPGFSEVADKPQVVVAGGVATVACAVAGYVLGAHLQHAALQRMRTFYGALSALVLLVGWGVVVSFCLMAEVVRNPVLISGVGQQHLLVVAYARLIVLLTWWTAVPAFGVASVLGYRRMRPAGRRG